MLLDGSVEVATEAPASGFLEFMRLSREESGLLSPSQAAVVLEVSPQRVNELLRDGLLKKWQLLGKTYVSGREVDERRKKDLRAGRPPRSLGQRLKVAGKLVGGMDSKQWLSAGMGV
jgi:hypothetical protein